MKTKPLPKSAWINDTDPAIRYTGKWLPAPKRGHHDYQDDVHYTETVGDAAEYAFTGTGIEVITERYRDMGRVDILLDGQPRGSVDLRQEDFPRLTQIRVFSAQGLPAGPHTIRIVHAGPGFALLDAFAVTTGGN